MGPEAVSPGTKPSLAHVSSLQQLPVPESYPARPFPKHLHTLYRSDLSPVMVPILIDVEAEAQNLVTAPTPWHCFLARVYCALIYVVLLFRDYAARVDT